MGPVGDGAFAALLCIFAGVGFVFLCSSLSRCTLPPPLPARVVTGDDSALECHARIVFTSDGSQITVRGCEAAAVATDGGL